MELYFDQDNGVLGYLTEDNNFIPVKTNSQLDPTHITLDEDGYLYLKSYVDDTVYQLKDAEGKPISLKGKKGDKGQDGVDGKDGKDGQNGADGKNGITPQLKIVDGYWQVSYNGKDWDELGKATEALALDDKQDKIDEGLILGNGKVVNAINEAFYNIWNPVHYAEFGSSSESKIVLTDQGELKLTWKYGQNPDSEERSIVVKTDTVHPSVVQFADQKYVNQFPSQKEIPTLNTSTKTIVGAINELALLHNLTGTISHMCYEGGRIKFNKIDKTLSTGVEYILQGSVNSTNGSTDSACVIAIPAGTDYSDPADWGQLSQVEYNKDIQIIDFGSTFTLDKEHVLYLVFMSSQDISNRLGAFHLPDAWIYESSSTYIGHTISVTNLNIIPSSESQAKQLESQKEIINQLGLQVQQLQTQLLELKSKTSWLDQLDQEGLVKAWGKEANS